MKPSSSSPSARPGTQDVVPGGEPAVRTLRFDRPLSRGSGGMAWVDPEVDRLVRQAIEEGRTSGKAQGYAIGWAEGHRAAAAAAAAAEADRVARADAERTDLARRGAALLASLAQAVRDLDRSTTPEWEELADVISEGVVHLARSVIARELSTVTPPVLESVRVALRAIAEGSETVTVRMNPAEAALMGQLHEQLPSDVRVVADPQVPPGEVRALTPVQRLELSLPQSFTAAERALRG